MTYRYNPAWKIYEETINQNQKQTGIDFNINMLFQ